MARCKKPAHQALDHSKLTAIGAAAPDLHVSEEVRGNRFAIAGGPAQGRVSWQIAGNRRDAYARAHPIPLEEDMSGSERGRYLNPDVHGQPASLAIGYRSDVDIEASNAPPAEPASDTSP